MYAKAIPTPLAIVTEFRKVPLFQRNNLTNRGKSWIAVKSRHNGIGVQKFAEPPSEINLRFVAATSHMKSIPAIYQPHIEMISFCRLLVQQYILPAL